MPFPLTMAWIIFSLHVVVDLSLACFNLIRCLVGREEAMGAMFFRGHRQTAAGSTSLRPGSLFSFNFSPPFVPSFLPFPDGRLHARLSLMAALVGDSRARAGGQRGCEGTGTGTGEGAKKGGGM